MLSLAPATSVAVPVRPVCCVTVYDDAVGGQYLQQGETAEEKGERLFAGRGRATGIVVSGGQPGPDDLTIIAPAVRDLKPIAHHQFQSPHPAETHKVIHQLTTYCIPFLQHDHPTGVIFPTGKYQFDPHPAADYKEAARLHRRDISFFNPATHSLRMRLNTDPVILAAPQIDSSAPDYNPILRITTAMQSMMVPPRTWQPVFRLLHDSLFVGDRAIRHQTQGLHMHRYAPHLIHPPCCVLPTCQQCQCSQHHEIFDCTAVRPLWAATKRLVAELGDPDPIPTDIYEYFRMLLIHGNTAKSPHGPIDTKVLVINLITLTLKAITNAYYTKMQEYEKQKSQPDPAKLATQHRSNLRRQYVALLREEVKQLPHHVNTLSKRNRFTNQVTRDPPRKYSERDLQLMPRYTYTIHSLPPAIEQLFLETWCKTHIVDIHTAPSGRVPRIRSPFH